MSPNAALLFVFIGIPLIAFGGQYLLKRRYQRRKQSLIQAAFPDAWEAILKRNVPLAARLPAAYAQRLRDNIKLFLAEIGFEGQGGVAITDEIRVTIAGQACLLTLGRPDKRYPKLKTVILYPSAFTDGKRAAAAPSSAAPIYRLGESWSTGTVILAWDSTRRGAINPHDGQNVALHEFAHQLDTEDGTADGAPILDSPGSLHAWANVFTKEYEIQTRKAAKGKRSVIDAYGATNPAEFFAVGTETFFEKPRQLKKKRPEVYAMLKSYYRLDPVTWTQPKADA